MKATKATGALRAVARGEYQRCSEISVSTKIQSGCGTGSDHRVGFLACNPNEPRVAAAVDLDVEHNTDPDVNIGAKTHEYHSLSLDCSP
jgi:hypothetical protein